MSNTHPGLASLLSSGSESFRKANAQSMKLVPLTVTRANEVVDEWHRHNDPVKGSRFALGCEVGGSLVGVAIIGRPVGRILDTSKVVEVTRLCTTPDAPQNTCSFLYAAARRVWFAMGGERVLTYTLQTESGASLRGAGFVKVASLKARKGWSNSKRRRRTLKTDGQAKFRWESAA